MKVAVSASGQNQEALVDPRFGRAHCFMIYDTDSDKWQQLENSPNLNAVQGAGIQTAEMLARCGVAAVITGHCGPKAFRVLNAAGISVYIGVGGTVFDAIAAYRDRKLVAATGPDVEGHWQ